MPIYLHLSNLVFDKRILEKKYPGGLKQFRLDTKFDRIERSEEDGLICSLPAMNVEDFDLEPFVDKGLHWDAEAQRSDDFMAISRYGGPHWQVAWLEVDSEEYPTVAWHQHTDPRIIARAKEILNMTLGEIDRLVEEKGDLMKVIHGD